jgi:indolepyruvate ferredoxin oxidoreductase
LNLEAFRIGRRVASDPGVLGGLAPSGNAEPEKPKTLDEMVALRAAHLVEYQDRVLADRYQARIAKIRGLEREQAPGCSGLAEAVAMSYFKLLAYKDEYEVARLYSDGRFERLVAEHFDGVRRIEYHLAPPLFARRHKTTGEPMKIRFGPWMLPVFRLLAKGKRLRGTRWDLFGASAERRAERQMIADFERLLDEIGERLSPATHATAVALAGLPQEIKGFGHVKRESHEAVRQLEARLLAELRHPAPKRAAAE